MNFRSSLLKFVWLSVVVGSPAYAHDVTAPECEPPIRPVNDQNDAVWQSFLVEIDGFRDCTQNRMEFHQDAVVEHQQAAKDAVAAWNDFVRTSLNAPEDFPWPPEDENLQ